MTAPILAAATFCIAVTFVQIASLAIAIVRLRRGARSRPPTNRYPPVSLIRPLCGIDNYAADTLRSTFALDYPNYEILFCVVSAVDPVLPLVRGLIAENPTAPARLLIGDDRVSMNPKLNNVVKGWRAAAHDWIIIADSNVLMPRDYIQCLFASWRTDTGLVASPPIGCRPDGFWAEIECAFLNTYQARWQYLVDSFGCGFAQGKTMLWRRADLERAGGIETLAKEVAEDAASTKIVRDAGLKVRLIDRPLAQPLGRRSASEVWNRQLRWARLRRASFFLYFLPEILSGGVWPMIAVAIVAHTLALPVAACVLAFGALWYGGEMALAAAAGWPAPALYPLYGLTRDLLLPVLFFSALRGNDFVWRGNEMQVDRVRVRPRRMIARMRPRMQEVAAGSRRRLRSLRERLSER
jgi:ceramide glucosyltransferase